MSENLSLKSGSGSATLGSPAAPYTSLVEEHASQLIDELFQDLNEAIAKPNRTESAALSSRTHPDSSCLVPLPPRSPELEDSLLVPYVDLDPILAPLPQHATLQPETETPERHFRSGLLLGVACASFVGSFGLWVVTQFNRPASAPAIAQAPTTASALANSADIAFANDLAEGLQTAKQMPELVPPASPAVATAPVATAALPQIPPTVVPSSLPIQPVLGTSASQPVATVPSAVKAQPKAQRPTAVAPKQYPKTARHTVALTSVGNRIPMPTLNNPSQPGTSTLPNLAPQTLPMNSQGKAGITVQGILDLGPQSAILISRNGSTQNIRLGEVLDSTGWVFLRVENGQAIVQRGSEIRSVSGGEQF
ncbi:MAG TPA: hypothetical protein V6D19_03705 [Stenomitos sp.]